MRESKVPINTSNQSNQSLNNYINELPQTGEDINAQQIFIELDALISESGQKFLSGEQKFVIHPHLLEILHEHIRHPKGVSERGNRQFLDMNGVFLCPNPIPVHNGIYYSLDKPLDMLDYLFSRQSKYLRIHTTVSSIELFRIFHFCVNLTHLSISPTNSICAKKLINLSKQKKEQQQQQNQNQQLNTKSDFDEEDESEDEEDLSSLRRVNVVEQPPVYRYENTSNPLSMARGGAMGVPKSSLIEPQASSFSYNEDPVASQAERVEKIFQQARDLGAKSVEEDNKDHNQKFSGTGMSLGDSQTQPQFVRGPEPPIERQLIFWSNGISIDDGPLLDMDNPETQSILRTLARGSLPAQLRDLQKPWVEVKLNLIDRKTDEYEKPKVVFKPFVGGGHSLTETSNKSENNNSSSSSISKQVNKKGTGLRVNEEEPITSISLRLSTGARLVVKFNQTHTVADLYAFALNASQVDSFELATTFPNKTLSDLTLTLKDAGLLNASVVQKIV
eukprot:c19964_g1_i1.p1 GENE.c19964_g1_i1~~c19964_g1_i1.p1  ORF type:complete len:504 (-),score=190.77 c19964_g1_i1:79-1590(-)